MSDFKRCGYWMLFLLLLGFVSCKTALKDKTEYESGWEFEGQAHKTEPKKAKKNTGGESTAKSSTNSGTTTSTTKSTNGNKSGISNANLKKEVEQWLGVPYKYGGTSKSGVDCSGFCGNIFKTVYDINLGRSAQDIYNQSKPINKNALKEGDLVFFKINSSRVSHVGIYLSDNKFVHASTSRGVMISDLTEAYWTKYYYAAGTLTH